MEPYHCSSAGYNGFRTLFTGISKMVAYPPGSTSIEIMQGGAPDYRALTELLAACYPEFVFDPEVLQAQDEHDLSLSFPVRRWVACQGQVTVACGEVQQSASTLGPPQLSLNICVHPEYRGQGLGGRLYHILMEHLPPHIDLSLCATLRSEDTVSLAFLQRRGFVPIQSLQEWELSLPCDTGAAEAPCVAVSSDAQITIRSVAELIPDPGSDRKLNRLIELLREEMQPQSALSVNAEETFAGDYCAHPSFFPEMSLIATDAGEYIGYSDLRDDGAGGLLYNLTGVLPSHRRQGVASALKRVALSRAQEQGYTRIRTFCSAENIAIQALNRKFGFEQTSAWTHLCKQAGRLA